MRAGLIRRRLAERHFALHADQLRAVVGHIVERGGDLPLGLRRRRGGGRRRRLRAVPARQADEQHPCRRRSPARRARARARGAGHHRAPRPRGGRRRRRCGRRAAGGASRKRTTPLTRAWTIAFWKVSVATSLLLLRVREEGHLDQHRRHVGADQHAGTAPAGSSAGPSAPARAARLRPPAASAAERSMWRAWASSHGVTSMSRAPPPNTGSDIGVAVRHPLAFFAVRLEAQIEDLGAGRAGPHRGVGVEADEQVGLVVVGDRGPLVQRRRCGRRRG